MGDVSKNFSRKEFKCKCKTCEFESVDIELIKVLEDVREFFNSPITITSGNRCISHNHSVGGSSHSKHMYGVACDFRVEGISAKEAYTYLDNKYPKTYGLGLYDSWVHLDMRDKMSRWNKTK